MQKIFNNMDKMLVIESLETLEKQYHKKLEKCDYDDRTRRQLHVIGWLKNAFETDIIDRLEISDDELDDIYC